MKPKPSSPFAKARAKLKSSCATLSSGRRARAPRGSMVFTGRMGRSASTPGAWRFRRRARRPQGSAVHTAVWAGLISMCATPPSRPRTRMPTAYWAITGVRVRSASPLTGEESTAAGLDASGVRVGNADSQGQVTLAAEVGEDGYRKQSVTVNAPVTGGSGRDAAGVFLAGGGRVVIGPRGSLGAESRIAIRAAGDAPRLHVDMNLDGRRVDAGHRRGASSTTTKARPPC